jgi:signal transduction histidine kinase
MATIAASAPATDTQAVRGPRPAVLVAIALGGCVAAGITIVLGLTSDHLREPGVHVALQVWGTLAYIFAGLVAWWRRPDSRFGPLMLATGVVWFLTSLSSSNLAVPYTIGIAFDLLPAVLFLHVFLAFPTGRLPGRLERALVGAGYATAFGAQLVGMGLGNFGPDNLLAVVSEPERASSLLKAQLVVLSGLCLTGVVLVFWRWHREGRPRRRWTALLVESFALGLVMLAFLFLSAVYGLASGQIAFETLRRITFFTVGLAPLVFLVGLLDARLARSAVGDLFVQLRADPAPSQLRAALARALRDPSLELAYWLPEYESWADLEGREVELPTGGRRAVTLIDRGGEHVAALIHDPSLSDEPELLEAVKAAAGMALENAQLNAELHARLEELRGSRARIVEATQKERQRLERNLHDGAQQRLVALSLELKLLEARFAKDPEAKEAVDSVRQELAESLQELRELARGIHPAIVTGHGLGVALESVAARSPVPVKLDIRLEERAPEAVEVAAYYLVAESLTNVAKYSAASAARVEICRSGDELVVEVVDDGVGGADEEAGSGLRGLADRVEALDGRLRVWSPHGGGTRLRAEIPCGS